MLKQCLAHTASILSFIHSQESLKHEKNFAFNFSNKPTFQFEILRYRFSLIKWATFRCMYLFQWKFYLDICPRMGLLGHMVVIIFSFLRYLHTVFHRACTNLHSHQLFTIAGHGNNLNAHWQINGLRICGIYTQWNTTQP